MQKLKSRSKRKFLRNPSGICPWLALPPGGKIVCLGKIPFLYLATFRRTSQPHPVLLGLMGIAVFSELCSWNNSNNEGQNGNLGIVVWVPGQLFSSGIP